MDPRSLKFTAEHQDTAMDAYQSDMIFPECKGYVDGQSPLEAVFKVIREAILSKGGLTDDIEAFRAELSDILNVPQLMGEQPVITRPKKELDFFKEGQRAVKESISSVKDLPEPKPWTIPIPRLHTYSSYA